MNGLPGVLDRLKGLSVVVLGDAMLDGYLEGSATRLCREAPVPVVRLGRRAAVPGGAANTAVNVAALGASVRLVSAVGRDPEGATLAHELEAAGVATGGVVQREDRRTLTLNRVFAGDQLVVRFDDGTSDPLPPDAEQELAGRLRAALVGADAVVLSDYGHGIVTPGLVQVLAEHRARASTVLVVDSKHPAAYRQLRPTAVKPNWAEALQLLGAGELDGVSERADGIAEQGDRILELTGAQIAAVTLDSEGAIVFERQRPPHRTYAQVPHGSRATGAGDTFVAALTLALAGGASTPAAAELASAAAAIVVGKDRTATCTAPELRAQLTGRDKYAPDPAALAERMDLYRQQGRRILFTNGCFDILHRGHITYLNRAKTLGDVLVVAVNDDGSVRRLKGPTRPINPLEDRAQVLAALSCVDHIVPFSGDSPTEALRAVRPDVYVKGGDYTYDSLPEAPLVEELGGRVQILPFMEDRSTTGMIDRIRGVSAAQ
ncbi:MAG TPA: D-glycero-beta-D-manno-heptose 1-phosphate adenylyltransferase [Acidimicrobiales bacterium]|nr:D-glycero-beta-D-manno-heptose 1-phosphate adenylyltransferase [Acidimicrobiales bacterium]